MTTPTTQTTDIYSSPPLSAAALPSGVQRILEPRRFLTFDAYVAELGLDRGAFRCAS